MSRYVDKDKLIVFLTSPTGQCATCEDCCDIDCVDCIRDEVIKNFSEADVVEVKHGFWEQGDYYDYGDVCSECEYDSRIEPCKYNYCPNCGAKMEF